MTQTKAEADELLTAVRNALDLGTLNPPRGSISQVFREVEKKLTFGRRATPYALADSVGYLCAYGYHSRAADAAIVLGQIDPLVWEINYMYVRGAIHTAYFFTERAGDHDRSARIEPFLLLPGPMDAEAGRDTHVPSQGLVDGSMLRHPFEAASDPSPENPIKYSVRQGSAAIMDLRRFAPMWIFGGSAEWPRDRIMAEVESTIEKLHELPGWQPW